jgi:WD40 repeat protein
MTRPSIDWWCFAIAVAVAFHLPHPAQAQNRSPVLNEAGTDLYGDKLPTGAMTRLGTIRFRHGSQWLKGLALTPDGTIVIAAAEEKALHFWDSATGRRTKELQLSPLNIRGFTMSPDGRQIAVAGFWHSEDRRDIHREVRIVDTASGDQSRTLTRTDPNVDDHAMAFTPDGKLLISLGTNGILRIEEVASGVEILQQRFDRDNSPSLALSPDGSTIAVSTGANTDKFFLWRWQSGEEPQELKIFGKDGGYGELAFSPDGKLLAACINHNARPLQIWDVASGRLLHRLALADPNTHVRGTVLLAPAVIR